ncbi:MAG: hypothetical protein FH762_06305 [Firmicutes bacterium]|nr:hypothetical protein [Bacillota bacterium]
MTPREIRANLMLKGVKQRDIAAKAEVSEVLVSLIIDGYRNGSKKAQEVKRVIAEVLDKDEAEIFSSAA